ncbi:MAG TPA: OB-fold domain-containing protein [Acidimicrobiales bacterium]
MTLQAVGRDDATEEFFEGTASGIYLIRRCAPHDHASKPQATLCPVCSSEDLRWEPASGRAKLVSWAIMPSKPAEPEEPLPGATVVAIAELEEGPWMWAQLVGGEAVELHEGLALRIAFERPAGSEAIPVLTPANL